jgi:hypothetical protein
VVSVHLFLYIIYLDDQLIWLMIPFNLEDVSKMYLTLNFVSRI